MPHFLSGGLACAATAGERGHNVTLFEAGPSLGGQFNLASRVPGKEEYQSTVRHFATRLKRAGVQLQLGRAVDAAQLRTGKFDHVVVATGATPRLPDIPGIDHPMVATYADVIAGRRTAGARVAIIGAGGIGFDVAELLTHEEVPGNNDVERFCAAWGIDRSVSHRGGLVPPAAPCSPREVWLLQRKDEALGKGLAKTTGWIRRALMARRSVHLLAGVTYERIDDAGLHVRVRGEARTLAVDTVVVCAGQESQRTLLGDLQSQGIEVSLIGGAGHAAELDATRSISEGVNVAAAL